jgi:cell division protein FtsN
MRSKGSTPRRAAALVRRRQDGAAHGLGMLIIGIIVGATASALFFGVRGGDPDNLGAGLRQLLDASKKSEVTTTAAPDQNTESDPVRTKFDFYTVLPEIERVLPETAPPPPDPAPEVAKKPDQSPKKPAPSGGFFMLQAGSYQRAADADRLKARLALAGFEPSIQHVKIQGRGDFFRVRIGPYSSMSELESANRQLAGMGIEALRLKVSQP